MKPLLATALLSLSFSVTAASYTPSDALDTWKDLHGSGQTGKTYFQWLSQNDIDLHGKDHTWQGKGQGHLKTPGFPEPNPPCVGPGCGPGYPEPNPPCVGPGCPPGFPEPNPPSAVPIPAAVWLFGAGLIGMVGIARRKS